MEKAYRFRMYPTKNQELQIAKTLGCCRFVYNYYLGVRKDKYERDKESFGFSKCSKDLTALKKSLPWLAEVDATALQAALRNLDYAYANFFNALKKEKKVGYPCFKRKRSSRQKYISKCNYSKQGIGTIRIEDGKLRVPILGAVKCKFSREIEGRILSATITREPAGKYYVSLLCTDVFSEALPSTGCVTGIDLGIHDLAVLSDGTHFSNNKYTVKSEARLARLQRQLSRKSKGSNNRNKARLKVARLQEHIANQRKDDLQKLTTKLIRNYDIICIEDLAPSNMVKNHHIARAIEDASFGEFRRELEYKAKWYGRVLVPIDRFYPSSQLCCNCGYQNGETKDLSVRRWCCPQCGTYHDRDVNAAVNILNEGMRILAS